MIAIIMTTAITPTIAPALKMPAIAEQLLKPVTIIKMITGSMIFFIFMILNGNLTIDQVNSYRY